MMTTLLFFTIYSALPLLLLSKSAAATTTAYDVLRSHGLPAGLLPRGVKSFSIDDTGRFEAHIDYPCTAKFETDVHYESSIFGTISYGQMASLQGISAQELFLWFPVKEIRVDVPSSGLIYFDVGVIHKQFSLSLFETPPECVPGSGIVSVADKDLLGKLHHDLDEEDVAWVAR